MIGQNFDSKMREEWTRFLNTLAGRTGLAFLRENARPVIRLDGEPHHQSFDLGAQKGFDDALRAVEGLDNIIPESPSQTHTPSLRSTRRE